MRALGITSTDELRQVDHRAVIAWERMQREQEGASRFDRAPPPGGPVQPVQASGETRGGETVIPSWTWNGRRSIATRAARRRSRKRRRGKFSTRRRPTRSPVCATAPFSPSACKSGFRRAEIAALNVGDLHQNRGFDALRVIRKGGRRDALAINPQAAQRIRAYLDIAGHGDQLDAPMFRPLRGNREAARCRPAAWTPTPSTAWCGNTRPRSALDAATRRTRCARPSSRPRLRTARSWRTCRRRPGIATRRTTKLYDRRGYNPEKAASFFATY